MLWKGVVQRDRRARQRLQFRLVIREMDIYDTDAEVAGTPPPSSVAVPTMGARLVFLDVFPLD